ncbi:MAG: Asp-tRNA(Asn)/Glu-tRNA(Gln) amidotransferase subunit GatC [Patescibacteria group bacterium]
MKISKKEVEHIAKLSRIKLSPKETEKFSRELTVIIDYIDKLKELKEKKFLSPKTFGQENKTRDDQVSVFAGKEKILKNAPKTTNNFIEVKGVFK